MKNIYIITSILWKILSENWLKNGKKQLPKHAQGKLFSIKEQDKMKINRKKIFISPYFLSKKTQLKIS